MKSNRNSISLDLIDPRQFRLPEGKKITTNNLKYYLKILLDFIPITFRTSKYSYFLKIRPKFSSNTVPEIIRED